MGGAAWLSIFGFGKAPTRKHIRSDLRPRSNATKEKKRRHPQGKSTSRRLAALLAPYPAPAGKGMLVTRALPATTNCFCAVSSYL
jgi:hypothetical protein